MAAIESGNKRLKFQTTNNLSPLPESSPRNSSGKIPQWRRWLGHNSILRGGRFLWEMAAEAMPRGVQGKFDRYFEDPVERFAWEDNGPLNEARYRLTAEILDSIRGGVPFDHALEVG